MADDLLEGVLGGDDEQSETEAPGAAAPEAFAAAVAERLSTADPEVARETCAFLKEQSLLLATQRRHLEEEHLSRLSQLRLAVAAATRRRYADYLRNGLYTGIALLLLGLLVAVTRMTYEAMSDHGLVVQDFTVQSGLAGSGVTDPALAEDLANRVAAVRAMANSHSLTYSSDVRANQADSLRVQIPETGVSLDEVERFLHRWLGHQTVVNGELREEAGGRISLVLHIAGAAPIVMSGASADLDGLMQTAAERAFAVFSPGQDIVYLEATGRLAEAYTAAKDYVHGASVAARTTEEQAGEYALLASADPDPHRALAEELLAIDSNPPVLSDWIVAPILNEKLGHDEAALDLGRKMLETKQRDQPVSQRAAYPWLIARGHAEIDRALGDFVALSSDYRVRDRRPNVRLTDRYADRADVAALLHDDASAQHELTLALASGPADDTVLTARWDASTTADNWTEALEAAKTLLAESEAQKSVAEQSAVQGPEFAAFPELALATRYRPLLALAQAMTGDTGSATALISHSPTDCYLCVRTRARIAAAAGDAAQTDRWFAEAIRQAPDLPLAYYEWGQALLARGDLAAAQRELSLAHDKGPHFADALKVWGDVLVRQGQFRQALDKYDQALKFAPQWVALKQARDATQAQVK